MAVFERLVKLDDRVAPGRLVQFFAEYQPARVTKQPVQYCGGFWRQRYRQIVVQQLAAVEPEREVAETQHTGRDNSGIQLRLRPRPPGSDALPFVRQCERDQ